MFTEVGRKEPSSSLFTRAIRVYLCVPVCACTYALVCVSIPHKPTPTPTSLNLTSLTYGSHFLSPVTVIFRRGSLVLYGYQQAKIQA